MPPADYNDAGDVLSLLLDDLVSIGIRPSNKPRMLGGLPYDVAIWRMTGLISRRAIVWDTPQHTITGRIIAISQDGERCQVGIVMDVPFWIEKPNDRFMIELVLHFAN